MENTIKITEISTTTCNSKIYCGTGAFDKYAPAYSDANSFVVTDDNVFQIYGDLIKNTFPKASVYVMKAGERNKNYKTLFAILSKMIECGMNRKSTVIAFGGGVVGDVAGLCASLYMRGVNLVQIPTTLLSQIDSSVGGKTAIDFGKVKNVIGTFYQPHEVIVDPRFLSTLPKREIRCGLGEMIKYAALDGNIYDIIAGGKRRLFALDFLSGIVDDCIKFKADVVKNDEKEVSGLRKILNLGHTTGHAFELYYGKKSHGEFVLIGLYYELYIAEKFGVCSYEYANALRKLIKKAIPSIPAYADADKAALLAIHDKKNVEGGRVSIVLPVEKGVVKEVNLSVAEYCYLIRECRDELR